MKSNTKQSTILIGIQARTTSDRLPGKVLMEIEEGITVLDVIIDAVKNAQNYINRKMSYKTMVKAALLIPSNDTKLYDLYKDKIEIHRGSLNDVLSRYVESSNYHHADFIVRVTADCIEMPSWIISRAIKSAIRNNADFVSNTIVRTSIEGQDIEVMSKAMLDYLDKHTNEKDREHVTSILYKEETLKELSKKFKFVHLLEKTYFAEIKTSIDTIEEFMQAKQRREKLQGAKTFASKYGIWEI